MVRLELLVMLVNNILKCSSPINIYLIDKQDFLLFLTIRYLCIFKISDLSIVLQSTEKLYKFPFQYNSLDSTASNLLDMFPR